MRKISIVTLIFVMFSLSVTIAQSSKSPALGFRYSFLVPDNDFQLGMEHAYTLGAFFRVPVYERVKFEFGAAYGTYKGNDDPTGATYSTDIIPIEARFLLYPFKESSFNPYLYAGAGVIHYTIDELSLIGTPLLREEDDFAVVFPLGVGLTVPVGDAFGIELSAGWHLTSTDELDGYKEDENNDNYWNLSAGISFPLSESNNDLDGDGLTNEFEEEIGTDPMNKDTDGDGLEDGDEVNDYKTDPLNKDSDGDTLTDYEEVKTYTTNPNNKDTDGDSLMDNEEVKTYSTDPKVKDTDGDKLEDGAEVKTHKTNPLKKDSDDDRLDDYAEVMTYKTNPLDKDSDKDNLSDYEELMNHKTNPLNPDTDGGTVEDGKEVSRGTDPTISSDDVIQKDAAIVLEGITFETNSASIKPESEATLQEALRTLRVYSEISVEIRGYTDNRGARDYNVDLSQRRAESVMNWLVSKGISASRMTAKGFGPDNPIATNDTAEGRAKNRRIEFVRTN